MNRDGYGVAVVAIWNGEDDERISDIEVEVVALSPKNEHYIGGVTCAQGESGMYYPVENFTAYDDLGYDDTHDLRDRWFASRSEAEEHADYTRKRWTNPSPWESFVQL